MPKKPHPIAPVSVAILFLPEGGTMAPFGLHEVLGSTALGSAGVGSTGIDSGVLSRPMVPKLTARCTSYTESSTGPRIYPQSGLTDEDFDVVIICDIHLDAHESPQGRWDEEIRWVQRHLEREALVCSTCSGAILLAEAGLLDGSEAASHWSVADLFRDRYPKVIFRPERILCHSGREGRLITTGGASSWQDLALYLIARFCGAEEAARVARLYLLGDRGFGQLPFASMVRPKQHKDAAVSKVQTWLVNNYNLSNPVSQMVEQSGLAERSFKRRFKAATGYTAVEYVQALRIEEAKQRLETEPTAIEDIAAAVGYEDPTFFRRLFKRCAGVTPAEYRRRNQINARIP